MGLVKYRCPECGRCWPVRAWPLSCACGYLAADADDSGDVALCGKRREFTPSAPYQPAGNEADGPGNELKTMLEDLNLYDTEGCGCETMRLNMNRWGVAGCRLRRVRIVKHLRKKAGKRSWTEAAWAALMAVRTAATWLNPLDPFGSLVDEACRRAEAKGTTDA